MNNRSEIIILRDKITDMVRGGGDIGMIAMHMKRLTDELEIFRDHYCNSEKWDQEAHISGVVEVFKRWRDNINNETDEEHRDYLLTRLININI